MFINTPKNLMFTALLLLTASFCVAQSNKNAVGTLLPPPPHTVVDGSIKEWGDSLRYYNTENHINYAVANTRDTLYMAIRVSDRSEEIRILKAGITFSIDPKGKKKDTFSITFPLNVNSGKPLADLKKEDVPGEVTQQDRDELMRERLTNLRGIRVAGFKDIEGDMITTSNSYGFQTAVNYDDNGYLVCEAAIPMNFFHADDLTKNEWAFNFKINGLQSKEPEAGRENGSGHGRGQGGEGGGFGGGRGGRGGRGGGGNRNGTELGSANYNELSKSEDFWQKFYLAK